MLTAFVRAGRQAELVSLDCNDKPGIYEVMPVVFAVRSCELDAIILKAVHDADMHTVGPDDFHMLSNGF